MNTVNLVDMEDLIEYAQINHSILIDDLEVSKVQNEQSLEKDAINSMASLALINIIVE